MLEYMNYKQTDSYNIYAQNEDKLDIFYNPFSKQNIYKNWIPLALLVIKQYNK